MRGIYTYLHAAKKISTVLFVVVAGWVEDSGWRFVTCEKLSVFRSCLVRQLFAVRWAAAHITYSVPVRVEKYQQSTSPKRSIFASFPPSSFLSQMWAVFPLLLRVKAEGPIFQRRLLLIRSHSDTSPFAWTEFPRGMLSYTKEGFLCKQG